jgi:hypothetical protein
MILSLLATFEITRGDAVYPKLPPSLSNNVISGSPVFSGERDDIVVLSI